MPTRSRPTPKTKSATKVAGEKYFLQLFIAGVSPNSIRAIENLNTICEKYLKDRYELEIIDIYQQPDLLLKEQIIAIPFLIKRFPLPEERLMGDLSNAKVVLTQLRITYPGSK